MEPKDLFRRHLPSSLVEEPTGKIENTFAYCECEKRLASAPFESLCLADFDGMEALDEVIVLPFQPPACRHNDRRADRAESPVLEVLAECVGFGRVAGNLPRSLPMVKLGLRDKTPAVGSKSLNSS